MIFKLWHIIIWEQSEFIKTKSSGKKILSSKTNKKLDFVLHVLNWSNKYSPWKKCWSWKFFATTLNCNVQKKELGPHLVNHQQEWTRSLISTVETSWNCSRTSRQPDQMQSLCTFFLIRFKKKKSSLLILLYRR